MKNYISLGAGVQSSTMLIMADRGLILPRPDKAFFADTQREPSIVYEWLEKLKNLVSIPIEICSRGDLLAASLKLIKGKEGNSRTSKKRLLGMKSSGTVAGKWYLDSLVPAHVLDTAGKVGILQRRCTTQFKIKPLVTAYRIDLGKRAIPATSPPLVTQWIGISREEEIWRVKPSRVHWILNRWPLVEMKMTREDCLSWMKKNGLPVPPRSACVFCPYRSDREWLDLRRDDPEGFLSAARFEKQLQRKMGKSETFQGTPFLHRSFVPLEDVVFNPKSAPKTLFFNECEGMCGN